MSRTIDLLKTAADALSDGRDPFDHGERMTTACGYCGAPAGRDRREQVHEVRCPFVPESERRVREKLVELEERIKRLEANE